MPRFRQRRRATQWRGDVEALDVRARTALRPATLYRFVDVGDGGGPREMSTSERDALGDPMATTFFHRERFPVTVAEVMAGLDRAGVVPETRSYLVSEAGQLDAAPGLVKDFRFAVVRGRGPDADLMISTSATDSTVAAFLQVAAWDYRARRFNFYTRVDEAWVWSGDSYTALRPESRGRACFDSHVNGSVVMKELKQPWLHWHSMSAAIHLAADDPVRTSPLFAFLTNAEVLEPTIRACVDRWTTARLDEATASGTIEHPDWLLRQLFTTTTVNLASSTTEYSSLGDRPTFEPPLGFWLHNEALLDVLGIPADFGIPAMSAPLYLDRLAHYGHRLTDGDFSRPGDTFFAFAVPEPAFEDLHVVDRMIQTGVLDARFVACALMVDFQNPVFSGRRARLLAHCPTTPVAVGAGLADRLAAAIVAAAGDETSPEAEFAANWATPDWPDRFAERIGDYLTAVTARLGTPEGTDDYVRLAESRCREFRRSKLAEFTLTVPRTAIPDDAPLLDMAPDGSVRPKT
ncbi:hypothetical protein [Saccharothrix texasensis]|uniref:Uncharacterized protein n=1 Tax=Saccharothrix texasensis TaxID=103734 RepID=A0A3N1H203_9PSEU|nr:hypothetical protein [Saccharothrix texasensis]ROP36540.1 hypothetical protein EDD40_1814 [Saccharothrix texasensis]